jgi:hypothetical protein
MPNAFKILKTLHLALFMCMLIFAVVGMVVVQQQMMPVADESFQRIFQVVCVIVSLSCLVIGFNIFKRKIMAARNHTGSGEKRMEMYRAACILWWAMIEGPGLLATIGYMLTANLSFLALAGLHILIILAFMPRRENIIVLLNLTAADVAELEGKV